MNRAQDYWTEPYSPYQPVGNDSLHVESDDIDYDPMYYTHFPVHITTADGSFPPPTIPIDIVGAAYVQTANPLYPPASVSSNQRQQHNHQLYIDTQLHSYQLHDSESSTASSSSLSNVILTPSLQFPARHPSVDISSPQSAPVERGSLMLDLEMSPPRLVSPVFHYPSKFGGDNMFNLPVSPLPMEPDEMTQAPMHHVLEWRRVIKDCGTHDFVPQTVYQPYTEADRKRYIQDVELQKTIFFQLDDSSELGIFLEDALKQRLRRLKDKGDRMFIGCGPSVSIRVQWPGYPPWSKQIPTMDFRNPKGHITRAKLAKNIATCLRHFVEFAQARPMEADSDRSWKVGQRHIKVEDLILVSLHHVSKGSWQPQLRLRHPFSTLSYQLDEALPLAPTSSR